MKEPTFRLFWLREGACDAGTVVSSGELPPPVRDRVMALTAGECTRFDVRLPFFDRIELRNQQELLSAVTLERMGSLIRAVLDPIPAARDFAATCVLGDPVWSNLPGERDERYRDTWQCVSLALQRWIRDRVAEAFYRDLARLANRPNAWPVVVYQACRLYYSPSRTEFTYDLRDYPWRLDTVAESWKLTGRPVQRVLAELARRLQEAGRVELSHRYLPVWHEDVIRAVQKRPRTYVALLQKEAALINAVIDLGTQRSVEAVNRFARTAQSQLRKVHGLDLRRLAPGLIEEAARQLLEMSAEETAGGRHHRVDRRLFEDRNALASR